MDLTISLKPFSLPIRQAYLDLIPEQEHEIARGKLDWKYSHNPAGTGMIAVAADGDQVLGLNGFVPGAFGPEGARAVGFQSVDTIVSPRSRGMGIFSKLVQCFYDQADAALVYGFPNLNSSPAFFGRLGWRSFGAVPLLIRPLRTSLLAKRFGRIIPDVPLPIVSRRAPGAVERERFDVSAAESWARFAVRPTCALARDANYLNWRVAEHPSIRYRNLFADDGSFVIGTTTNKHDARIGYVMEAIGPNRSIAPLIAEMVYRMRGEGAECALAWCLPWSPNYQAFRRAGFLPFPARFRPILLNFGARAIAARSLILEDRRNWYISYLDSDTA